jgi:hypothetical protein
MGKYPLIGGSICAIILIILSSFTNVAGYQIVQHTGSTNRSNQSEDAFSMFIENTLKKGNTVKHPFLFLFVYFYLVSHSFRGWILFEHSISMDAFYQIEIKHPILFLRACWLILLAEFWSTFWQHLSSELDWNWLLWDPPWYSIQM